ncbi:protein AF-10-like isoform X1 [Aethina tumida]|uniref:protein AF-10-like isoform X1 n=1 Tax=Aethina tumida TaxID=116153 RepID=UPI00096AD9E8|nr:protein AF-10-like isoform X1 [Aethina tumida]
MREMVGGCCVCSDDRGWSENPLVYCDGQSCNVAVHQACYGIVTVPTGPWYCRKCESQERSVKVKCELCPSKYGALKRTDNSGWAHVVCALYIPEVRFGNVTTMEPIQLQLIPQERFNKSCYICEEKGKPSNAAVGACMQCNKAGCKQQFHVTCAQGLGLLCEEAGNYLDNVKYCGYCQHHYSKLKKGGNVKTIPPYKPVSAENHNSDSNSEKETDSTQQPQQQPSKSSSTSSTTNASPPVSKRSKSTSGKSSSSNKSTSSSTKPTSSSSSSSSSSQQKTVHNSGKSSSDKSNKISSSPRGAKSEEGDTVEKQRSEDGERESSGKYSKKRKTNSRTPTPVSVSPSVATESVTTSSSPVTSGDKRSTPPVVEGDKAKKLKIDTTQSIIISQPVVALTSISTLKPPASLAGGVSTTQPSSAAAIAPASESMISALPTQQPSVVVQQSAATTTTTAQAATPTSQPPQPSAPSVPPPVVNSLVVSVPLASTSLSPHHPLISNQTSVLTAVQTVQQQQLQQQLQLHERKSSPSTGSSMTGGNSNPPTANMLATAEMTNTGNIKITFEKQPQQQQQDVVNNTEVDMELEVPPTPPEEPTKRGRHAIHRTQSSEKGERGRGGKKRNGSNNGSTNGPSQHGLAPAPGTSKRSSRGQHPSPTPQPTSFAGALSGQPPMAIKDSPPSSPESTTDASSGSRGRPKGRKSAPAAVNMAKDTKDIKFFQNGVTAPHMLGNQLNPNSNMAQKMSDHLNSELEAHSIFNPNDNASNLIGPQLHHRVTQSTRASSTGGSSTASGGSGLSSMLGGGGGNIPQTLDQLLERQWEQGSQFLMEQAQHFDIASLLSCLHQLRAENLRLEEHVSSLLQRRDHLLAVNARLAIPLTGQPNQQPPPHPHTVNNIHPDVHRSGRHGAPYGHQQGAGAGGGGGGGGQQPVENGLPADQYGHPHRSPASNRQSPTVRHSGGGPGYPSSGMSGRQSAETGGRSAPRPSHQQPPPQHLAQQPPPQTQQPSAFGLYQQAAPQQQMVIRREEMHHQSSKPS